MRLEFHARDGGADAALFARQLADAVSIRTGRPVEMSGRVLVLHCL